MARSLPEHTRFVPAPAPRTPKAARTRRLLLDVAAGLFIERGYAAVSMQDIVEAAGLTKGALYGHFKSKGQLLVEVIRWKLAEQDERSDFDDIDVGRGVQMLYSEDRRELRMLEVDAAAAARHDPDVATGIAAFQQSRFLAIREATAGMDDPDAAAWLIAVLNFGIGVSECVGPPMPNPARAHTALLAALGGLAAEPPVSPSGTSATEE